MGMQANKTSATTVTFSQPQEIVISHLDDSIKIGDGTQLFTGGQKAAAASIPANLSTEDKALATTANTELANINTELNTQTTVLNNITSSLDSALPSNAEAVATRAVLTGIRDDGTYRQLNSTVNGHLEVAIHDPLLPFGSVHTENLTPIFQFDAVYGLNDALNRSNTQLSGSVTTSDSMFVVSSGTTVGAIAAFQSRKRLRYRAGQGSVLRYTAMFSAPVANSYQLAGLGHPEDGYFWGYNGTTFGIHKSTGGAREIQTLTINTASSTTESVTLTLDSVAFSVPVTNSANANRTAWEIARFASYIGWQASQVGNTVVFLADVAGNKTGTFSVSGTTIVGSFAETRAGASNTFTTIAQADFNGDKLDGTGGSGITVDPTKLNVYGIDMQYLGAGTINFRVMATPGDDNNATWVTAHTIKNPNTLTSPHVRNPSMPFSMTAVSLGSTTNLTIKSASVAGFIEGIKLLHGPRLSYFNSITTVGAVNIQALMTIKNELVYAGKANQSVCNLISMAGAVKHTNPVIYYLVKNGTLTGNPNFQQYSAQSSTYVDTAALTVTYSDASQLLWTGHLGETGNVIYDFARAVEDLTLQPGEYVTLGARSVSGAPPYVTGSLNTREDQ